MTEKLNDMDTDLRSRVVGLEHKDQDKSQRIAALEAWQRQREVDSARHDEKWNAMEARIDTRFASLESSVGEIKTALSKINWLIISGILAGVIGFLIRGGFHIP